MILFSNKKHCTCCLSSNIYQFLDFGEVPLAGSFIKTPEELKLFPLSLSVCTDCFHVQVNQYVDKNYLFSDYRYISGVSMLRHFEDFSSRIAERFPRNSSLLEIGSNDGTHINLLLQKGFKVVGVEPAKNIAQISANKGHEVINDFFSKEVLKNNNVRPGSFNIITASNCFAHIEDIDAILEGVVYALSEDGTFIIEVHSGPNLFATLQYDFIYNEHMYYYSLSSLRALLQRHGLNIYDLELISTHGGSFRVYTSKTKREGESFLHELKKEGLLGFHDLKLYQEFNIKVQEHLQASRTHLKRLKREGNKIVAYGASGRVNAFLNYASIGNDLIDYIIDDSPERYGRLIPKQNIPIEPLSKAMSDDFDILLVGAWNFYDQIIEKAKALSYKYSIVMFPEFKMTAR